ncbi:hypothetical protein NEHOM01_0570 [Nematocida homosporus]|uniref:uncharacterized protein n=1 Tax=Nematocida homosporus TaxID=1912981 RepID=UPI00222097D0|nr:uncharacterized protein NEHOM01_0570 [Nematocida homosporus]KAI5185065.1 hypothetical protein NEHOM01_0570 [Nematocida homosporus]
MQERAEIVEKLGCFIAGPHRRSLYATLDSFLGQSEMQGDLSAYTRLQAMKAYALAADGKIEETREFLSGKDLVKFRSVLQETGLEQIMMRTALRCLDRIGDMKGFMDNASEEEKFEVAVLEKDYKLAQRYGAHLISTSSSFAVLAVILAGDEKMPSLLGWLLDKAVINASLLRLLYRLGLGMEVIKKYLGKCARDFPFYLLLRDLLVGGEDISVWVDVVEGPDSCWLAGYKLLSYLDDWLIYAWLIEQRKQGMENRWEDCFEVVAVEKSVNRRRYLMETRPSPESLLDFARTSATVELSLPVWRRMSVAEQEMVLAKADLVVHWKIRVLSEQVPIPWEMDVLSRFLESVDDVLFLVGSLVARRTEEDLLLALVLLYALRKNYSSFEPNLVLCVLMRYFLMCDKVAELFVGLDPQHVQLETISYLWSDVHILLQKDNLHLEQSYTHTRSQLIANANNALLGLVQKDQCAQAVSLLKYRDALLSSAINQQIVSRTLKDSPISSAQNVLIKPAQYIFRKVTESPTINSSPSVLITIDSIPAEYNQDSLHSLFWQAVDLLTSHSPIEIDKNDMHDLYTWLSDAQQEAFKILGST